VERVVLNALAEGTAPLPPDICPFGDSFCHRFEVSTASLRPDWHFQEKSIHLRLEKVPDTDVLQ
jgi:hypothetical protein